MSSFSGPERKTRVFLSGNEIGVEKDNRLQICWLLVERVEIFSTTKKESLWQGPLLRLDFSDRVKVFSHRFQCRYSNDLWLTKQDAI